jgi:hypothetical protein
MIDWNDVGNGEEDGSPIEEDDPNENGNGSNLV